jgi:ribonuclease G
MSQELLINVTPQETRVAVLENGVVQEILVERTRKRGIVGNLYKGRISRVLPGMQAAFVDIGIDRAAFLHASDILVAPGSETFEHEERRPDASITQLVHEGQELLVQVIKDPLGTKGARLTTNLTVASRYLVHLPGSSNLGVSVKIEDETERTRLKELLQQQLGEQQGGYIVRTAAEGVGADELRADMAFLQRLWASLAVKAKQTLVCSVVYEDLPLALRVLRDYVSVDFEKIRIDSRETYQRIQGFVNDFLPHMAERVQHYPGERPIFDLYGVEDEIQRALEKKVPLKSGGYLIIDQTEAMTTVDVNTGAYVGNRNLDETIFKTNLEAAHAIARQLRLRNLGGIIILDFIDMENDEHKRQVLRALEKSLEKDHAKVFVSGVTELGLVQMTRKRTRESLEHILCQPCSVCGGRGTLKTAETVCYEIFREILRAARQFDCSKLLVLASQDVIDRLLDEESTSVAELESFIGKPIKLQIEALYNPEQYDVVLL